MFTFQIPLWRSRLPGLHKDGKRDHVSNHDGKRQEDHEGHSQGAVEDATAAGGAERGQRPALPVSSCGQVERMVGGHQQGRGAPGDADVGKQGSHGPS